MNELEQLRKQLDELDTQLTSLFQKRFAICEHVGEYKKKNALPVLDAQREEALLNHKKSLVTEERYQQPILKCFEEIMRQSRLLQTRQVCGQPVEKRLVQQDGKQSVVYCGIPGSYAWQAAKEYFGSDIPLVAAGSFEQTFEYLRVNKAQKAVLPIENSSTGSVSQVYDLLGKYGFYIVGEHTLQIHHCLLAKEGVRLEDIRAVYSHQQALDQSTAYIHSHNSWKMQPMYNTAAAAEMVSQSSRRDIAAIASKEAAQLYHLNILQENIHFKSSNTTRFIIISPAMRNWEENNKVSIAFRLPHKSGSLYNVLKVFAQYHFNLVKIESRPVMEKNWEYLFFVDFVSTQEKQDFERVLKEVSIYTSDLKLLGLYRQQQ